LPILLAACFAFLGAAATDAEPPRYLGPLAVVVSRAGDVLYVAHHDARQIAWVDVAGGTVVDSVSIPGNPTGLALGPDGKTLYVSCEGPAGTVVLLDTERRKVLDSIPVGHTPMGPAVSPDGGRLYVCNRFDNDVSVIELDSCREIARIATRREPIDAALTPDGRSLVVIDHLPTGRADTFFVLPVVTIIDTQSLQATFIQLPNGSTGLREVCLSPDGRYAFLAHILSNYQLVPSQVTGGWSNQNVLSVVDVAGKKLLDTSPLDDLIRGAGNPWAIGCTSDGRTLCVAHAGSRELSAVDAEGLLKQWNRWPREASLVGGSPYDPGIPSNLKRRISLPGTGARGLATIGSKAFVVEYFSDSLDVVDLGSPAGRPPETIRLGPPPNLTERRRGEMLFHDATICFETWQSCSTCHPDARADGLNWDLVNDGVGNPKNTKSMLLAHATPPAMATGIRPSAEAAVRSGIRHTLFAERPEADAAAIDAYLESLAPVASPRLVDGRLGPAAVRGKRLFESREVGCVRCHPAPWYTDLGQHDVGTRNSYDHRGTFDTPSLIEAWRTAPYLHDGRWATVEELIAAGKHGSAHGEIDRLDRQQIDDLVEFVLSL
jgi:YVTN family beta-propeller protein